MKIASGMSSYLWSWSEGVDAFNVQRDVLDETAVRHGGEFDDCVERHVQVGQLNYTQDREHVR